MAETVKIPGELESTATGNKVVDVANVKDKTQGNKTQFQINADVEEAIGADDVPGSIKGRIKENETALGEGGSVDQRIAEEGAKHYLKSETYTKSELNNMITTPNQEYVSVIATDQTTSVTDVLPATGAADTTYRVGNWDGTQYNDSVFSEYAWNGSAYIKLSTKSQVGEVYDISANHADTKYADLSAALGTNGANIPESLRKGGMSVKYVQTYDNKYVQFRYMSTSTAVADFTNVTNWQGVDDEPTAGSDNLVKSGGVASALEQVTDIHRTFTSFKNLLYNDTTGWDNTPESVLDNVNQCRYINISGSAINIGAKNFNKGYANLPAGRYSLFVKVGLDIENNDDIRAKIDFGWGGSSTEKAAAQYVYANETPKAFYLGDLISTNSNSYFYIVSFSTYRTRAGESTSTSISGKCKYYGAYLIETSLLDGIDKQELAEKLDYSVISCNVVLTGEFDKLKERVGIIEEEIEPLPQIIENVDSLLTNNKTFGSSYDVRYNSSKVIGGTVDDINKLRYYVLENAQLSSISPNVPELNSPNIPNGTYALFAKVNALIEDGENVYTGQIGFGGGGSAYSDKVQNYTPFTFNNVAEGYYLGEVTKNSGASYFYLVNIKNIKKNGGFAGDRKDVRINYYGGYLIPVNELVGINRDSFAKMLDYEKGVSNFSYNAIYAINSVEAEHSAEAEHSEDSDMAIEATKLRTTLFEKYVTVFGDSLVTYSSGFLSKPLNYLGLIEKNAGIGGGRVNNWGTDRKNGFCTIENLALLPKNAKVIIFWGGANDYNLYAYPPVGEDGINNERFGYMTDKPLGVADMFNYRVTLENMDILDTPGRTQTFIQAYKTLLRNISILFPHALLVCVTQYRAYSYNGGKQFVTFRKAYPRVTGAEKDCAAEYGVPVCDLFTKAGVNDSNCFSLLYDDGGSLIHPNNVLAERCANLMAQTVKENMFLTEPEYNWSYNLSSDDKDVRELKEYLVDLRSEDEYNVMTLEEAIQGFISYTTEKSITLKNNMYLVFYSNQYGHTLGYFLIDYENPSNVNSWEQWTYDIIYDMRTAENPQTHQPFGALTLNQAIAAFQAKATLERWEYSNIMYMYFYTDANNNWSMYRLTNSSAPSSTSSWTLIKSGQDS